MSRIAILESDRSQACLLQHWLIAAGHVPQRYDGSAQLIEQAQTYGFDALLLECNGLGSTGMNVLSRVRQEMKSNVAVVAITSRTSEEDIVHALQQGADDCIAKPLRQRELLARLDAVTRRTRNFASLTQVLQVGALRLDVAARRAYVDGSPVVLTSKDFDLAVLLLSNVGRFLSRAQISEAVWGHKTLLRSRTLDTHTSRVRIKLCLSEPNGWRLLAVYGQGYRLERSMPIRKPSATREV